MKFNFLKAVHMRNKNKTEGRRALRNTCLSHMVCHMFVTWFVVVCSIIILGQFKIPLCNPLVCL